MADDLKRVGLVFKADGSVDFVKSLKLVNAELRENYQNFKLTQEQWDKSTTATQKLKDKLDYLNQAYDIQKDKVTALRTQLIELQNEEEKDETAIQKKKASLNQAEASLQRYKNQIDDTTNKLNTNSEAIKEFGKKVEEKGNAVEKAGRKLSAFSAASLAALTASAKGAIEFETAFTGVEKTVDATDQQLEVLKTQIRQMAKEIPSSTTEISAVAEAAGQLGIKKEDIMSFTRVMIDLGNSTNLSAEEAASSLAKFANVTKMSADNYSNLGSVIVALGNNFATTEADIVAMATRLAATGELTGLTQAQIMGLATAMSSVGIEAEAGGTAMSKLLKKMQVAIETGSEELQQFSAVAGMTSEEFKQAFEKDAVKALSAFIAGLNDTERNGASAISILEDMDIKEVRLSNTILSLANSSDLMNRAVDMANQSWEENNALSNEANKRYETLQSKITIALNKLKNMGITLGNKLMPSIEKVLDKTGDWIEKFDKLDDKQIEAIVNTGAFVAALGPVLTIAGKTSSGIGKLISTYGQFREGLGSLIIKAGASNSAMTGVLTTIQSLTNPVGLLCIGVGALAAAFVAHEASMKLEKASLGGLKEEVENQRKSWDDLVQARQNSLSSSLSEIEVSERLYDELKQITDENGQVKEGYEKRAETILNQLNNALGTEYQLNGNIIEQYGELKSNIDKIITAKKAEAVLTAYQQEYGTAIKEQSKAIETLIDLKKQQTEVSKQMSSANGKERSEAMLMYSSLSQKIGEQTELIGAYGKTIQDYEGLQKANIQGTSEEISKAINEIGISYEKSKEQAETSIEAQIIKQGEYVELLKQSLDEAQKNNDQYQTHILESQLQTSQEQLNNLASTLLQQTSTIGELSPEQIQAWKYIAEQSKIKYSEELSYLPEETRQKIENATGVVATNYTLPDAMGNLGGQGTSLFAERLKMAEQTNEEINQSSSALYNDGSVPGAAGNLADRAQNAVASNNSNSWGQDMVQGLGNGIQAKGNSSWFTGILSGLAGKIASFLHFSRPDQGPLREYEKWMPDMVEGLGKSLDKASPNLINKVKNMSDEMSSQLQNVNGDINIDNNKGKSLEEQQNLNIQMDYEKMSRAFLSALNSSEAITMLNMILDKKNNSKVVLDTGVLVGETKDALDTELANNQTRRRRGN